MNRRTVLVILVVAAVLVVPAITVAEHNSIWTAVGNLHGSSNDLADPDFGRYSQGVSWSSAQIDYMSVWGHGWNSEYGWHLVSNPFLYCTNCTAAGAVTTYRCGDLYGSNCSVANYATHRHYFEDSVFGARALYTSHVGNASSSCHFYRNC